MVLFRSVCMDSREVEFILSTCGPSREEASRHRAWGPTGLHTGTFESPADFVENSPLRMNPACSTSFLWRWVRYKQRPCVLW